MAYVFSTALPECSDLLNVPIDKFLWPMCLTSTLLLHSICFSRGLIGISVAVMVLVMLRFHTPFSSIHIT